jgi:WD40 repeat protein
VVYCLGTKKQHKINRKHPLKTIKWHMPYFVSVHEDGSKKGSTSVELYDFTTSKSTALKLPNEDNIAAAFVDHDRVVVVGKNSLYKSTKMQSSDTLIVPSLTASTASLPGEPLQIPSQLSRIALVGDDQVVSGIINRLSHLRGQYLTLISARQIQIWDVETGRLVNTGKPKNPNSTFLLSTVDKTGAFVAASTTDEISTFPRKNAIRRRFCHRF